MTIFQDFCGDILRNTFVCFALKVKPKAATSELKSYLRLGLSLILRYILIVIIALFCRLQLAAILGIRRMASAINFKILAWLKFAAVLTCTNLVPIFVLLFKFKLEFDDV